MMKAYTCCKLGLCSPRVNFLDRIHPDAPEIPETEEYQESGAILEVVQPLHIKSTQVFPQFSQFALEALYRFQTSMQTAEDSCRLAYELELAEQEQN